jgi:tetratricopeptide (TPR) repeat protein
MRPLLTLFFIVFSLWQNTPLLAQPNTPPDALIQARQLSQSAEVAYHAGDFGSALDDYSLSYSLSQDPHLLFLIAQCQQKLRNYPEAIQHYRDFLAKTSIPLSEEQRQEVESLILEAQELDKQQPNLGLTPQRDEPKEASLLWAPKPARSYAPFFAISGLTLVSAAISATFSVQTANNVALMSSSELVSSEQLNRGRSLSLLLAVGADALILTSAIVGTIGVVKWHDQKRELSAKASANTLWVQLRY